MSRPDFDLSVYLVTDTAQCGGPEEIVETVLRAISGGVTLVQFRDHDLPDDEFVALGRRVRDVCEIPLIIDDRVHLVAEIGADGAHVGQSDMPVAQAREVLGDNLLIGLSAQTPAHVEAALSHGPDVVDVSPWPVCVIGGVTASDAQDVARVGCDGLSVVSAICRNAELAQAWCHAKGR